MKLRGSFFAIVASLVLGFASQAHAGLLGSNVNTQYYSYGGAYNGGGSPASFVANGTQQATFFNYYSLTVFDNKVEYDFLESTTWSPSSVSLNSGGLFITNGNLLTFSGASPITSVTLDGASSVVPGFGIGNVSFNSTNIAVDWQQVHFNAGDKVILNVSAVPEPETYAMLLAGLGLLGAIGRRRKQAE